MKKKLAAKLSDLEHSSVIQKVDKPTEWVSRMAISEKKSGDIRVCIDPQIMNLAHKREIGIHYRSWILPELYMRKYSQNLTSETDNNTNNTLIIKHSLNIL